MKLPDKFRFFHTKNQGTYSAERVKGIHHDDLYEVKPPYPGGPVFYREESIELFIEEEIWELDYSSLV